MPHLDPTQWGLLVLGAAFAGFSKTAVGGAGGVAAALFALALPARESSGALLPLLVCGDLIAVAVYRRAADRQLILRLLPWVLAGLAGGVAFLAVVRVDRAVRVTIGILVLLALVGQLLIGRRLRTALAPTEGRPSPAQRVAAAVAGTAVGFSTMIANAAGSIMTIYLLLLGVPVLAFVGTGAWFFAIVNLIKLPLSAALGLVHPGSLVLDAALLPGLVAGAALGAVLIRRIDRERFERVALLMAAVSAVVLLL